MTITTPPRRRWFRFCLRTFFVVVALLALPCAWLGWQVSVVRERVAVEAWMKQQRRFAERWQVGTLRSLAEADRARWWPRLLGDPEPITRITYPDDALSADIDRVRAAFPEAEVRPRPTD